MSRYDYERSHDLIRLNGVTFAALIMAAYRKADTDNAARLVKVFPGIAAELKARYNAPGGLLPGEGS